MPSPTSAATPVENGGSRGPAPHVLRLRDTTLTVAPGRPLVMGIVNASPDSFSDGARAGRSAQDLVEDGLRLVGEGAAIIDVGGESAVTHRPAVAPSEEARRVVAVVEGLASAGVTVSIDTYKPAVAEAALEAGASLVNDVSGLRDPALAELCAAAGAGLVVMHTRAAPKQKTFPAYPDVVADVERFLAERMQAALGRGVSLEQLIVDPGLDFAKTPADSVRVLRALPRLRAVIGRPTLLATSRKDFIGALTARTPRARLAGTLAAVGAVVESGAAMVRVHDVAEVVDFLRVRAALAGDSEVPRELRLAQELRHEPS